MYSCVVYVKQNGEIHPRYFEFPTLDCAQQFITMDDSEMVVKSTIIGSDGQTIKG